MEFPIRFQLKDGTAVDVYRGESDDCFEFYLTRLNSEKHNFLLIGDRIEESYETRFDELQREAVALFRQMQQTSGTDK